MSQNRRSFLIRAAGALAACACCPPVAFAATPAKGGHGAAPHWTYEGKGGPTDWGKLSPNFKTCAIGTQQTPIDLKSAIPAQPAGGLAFSYKPFAMKILNNGHTIQVNAAPGSTITVNGESYELLQFHFHHPSEHLLSGKALDLECHFVHRSASGALAVVGVFITPGAENETLKTVFAAMPAKEGPEVATQSEIDPAKLLSSGPYFRYMGSLTTPPCSEGLTWSVFEKPIEASKDQILAFAKLFANNARPVQPLNNRFLLEVGL
jgi:carbonic anhydrase